MITKRLLFCLSFLIVNIGLFAQANLGFEKGNFSDWVGYTWRYSTDATYINTQPVAGIVNRRHTIMSDTSAYDANTGYKLRKIPKGYKYSVRLGDEIITSDKNPRGWQQSLRYTMTIDSSNALLIFKYACVLQYAANHSEPVEARFKLTLYDKDGNVIPDCSNYDVYATNQYVKGFNLYTPTNPTGNNTPVNWRDWTTVGANLIKYLGQSITIEFIATDCTGRYHFGYAYFVADCQPLNITVKYCANDSVAALTGPIGFESYKWRNRNNELLDSSQTLKLPKPSEGETFTCTMQSATGCTVSLSSTIAKFVPKADFSSYMIDCKSNIVQFNNLSTSTRGSLQYKWIFEDSVTSLQKNPRYKFKTSGLHPMMLVVKNPPSTCADTIKKVVESFSPPLVGISGDSTYCPNSFAKLNAYGAYRYDWSTGSKAGVLEVSQPGGIFWLVGHSSTGCHSDTIYKTVKEDPPWDFLSESDTTLCTGFSSILKVSGAAKYTWNTGDTVNSITVNTPGSYNVIGSNKRGCKKSFSFNVLEYPIPGAIFSTFPPTLNSKYNQLKGSLTSEPGVNYLWEMGDGSYENGSSITHAYNITNTALQYKVKLTATSQFDCADSSVKVITVVPFVPNVFTPNGDGVNDIFMAGLDIRIFDRNGLLLYQGKEGWNGQYKGKPMDPDTYFFSLEYSYDDQVIQSKKGYITLIR
jgi:gliding motility-associated-like protein